MMLRELINSQKTEKFIQEKKLRNNGTETGTFSKFKMEKDVKIWNGVFSQEKKRVEIAEN